MAQKVRDDSFEVDSETDLLELKARSDRGTFLKKTFSTMETGSLRGSVFTLCMTAVGPEYLFSAAILKYNGLVIGLCLVLLIAFVSRFSLNILVKASSEHKIYNYAHLVEHLFSSKHSLFLEICIIVYELGMLISLQVMLGQIMPLVLNSFGANVNVRTAGIITMIFVNFAIMTPLSMFRDLTSLQYASFSGIVALSYIALVTLCEFPFFAADHGLTGLQYFHFTGEFLVSVPLCLLLYFGHTNVCTVAGELAFTSKERMYKVTERTQYTLNTINFFIALFGYLSSLEDTTDISIMRPSVPSLGADYPTIIGRLGICLTLICVAPINLHPIRSTMTHLFFNKSSSLRV
jgi:sodium-coupled neutral amino acid transporter 2